MRLLERRKDETKITDYKVRAIGAYEEALQYLDAAEKMDSKRCELHLRVASEVKYVGIN